MFEPRTSSRLAFASRAPTTAVLRKRDSNPSRCRHALGLGTGDTRHAAFQEYAVIHATTVAKIPDSVSFEEATVLPLALSTASAGLFQPGYLELPFPSPTAPASTGKSILVWGGSSSVGAAAIQLAKASGIRVVSTASPANHDAVKALGADVVVDYKDEDVVQKLVAALEGTEFGGVYDAISEKGSIEAAAEVAQKVGGKQFIATVLPPPENLPGNVKAAGGEFPARDDSRCPVRVVGAID